MIFYNNNQIEVGMNFGTSIVKLCTCLLTFLDNSQCEQHDASIHYKCEANSPKGQTNSCSLLSKEKIHVLV